MSLKRESPRMLKQTLTFVLAVSMLAAFCYTSVCDEPAPNDKDGAAMLARENKTTVSVSRGDRAILSYRHSDVPMKPYVDQLFSPKGVQVLRDSPFDHKHHHALMFATAVDGVDCWAETPQSGKQKQRSLKTINQVVLYPDGQWYNHRGLAESLDWIGPASDKPLLIEDREVCVLAGGDRAPEFGATLVEWRSRLETPPGKETAVLTGEHYFGLGMRFLVSMDGGRFFNADDKQGEIVRGDERLTPVKWCAYTAKADGKPVTVAVFDHPDNPRYPARMFTMTKPFAYLSATRNEWKEPITIKAGTPLNLHFAVAVWDGETDKATVEKFYQRWLKLSSSK
jgi:hypothetical protein